MNFNNDNNTNGDNKSGKYVPPYLRDKKQQQTINNRYNNRNRHNNNYRQKEQHLREYQPPKNSHNLPGYKLQEQKQPIVPIDMESHKAGCEKANPYKMNFLDALRKNNKSFDVSQESKKKAALERSHHYDYVCANCSKMVKREGLNVNNTNYCWECHSDIVFKELPIIINDEDDDEYSGVPLKKRYEIRYQNYLEGKYDHYFDDYY